MMRIAWGAVLVHLGCSLALQESIFLNSAPVPKIICLGNDTAADCVDPTDENQCQSGKSQKAAITYTFDQYVAWPYNESFYQAAKHGAEMNNADLVLLLPAKEAPEQEKECDVYGRCTGHKRVKIPDDTMKVVEQYFKIVHTPWVVPPGLSRNIPREGGCCGAREFMKLHAMALEDYDAVVNLDTDMTVVGSLKPLFDCAASGRFLTARGSISGVNGGMFAVQPSRSLLYDMVIDLTLSQATEKSGWNNRGLAPDAKYGQAGLQGFLYYYFYQRGPYLPTMQVGQVDPCLWTGAAFCNKDLTCKKSPLRHKIKCDDGKARLLQITTFGP